MFQKLWPFNGSSQNNGPVQANEHQDHGVFTKVKPIHASFNKGIPLNMKIVIRGDIRTGKTSIFQRLQGLPFQDERHYRTTDQIQVANIPWQYPHTKDIIKVEIWDVVDKGIQAGELNAHSGSNTGNSLKIDNGPISPSKVKSSNLVPHAGFSLDASTIDVYRNTDGVIILYDISKPWTFDFAATTLADVPLNMPVLILSNFSDDSHPRPVIESERIEALMQEHNDVRRKHICAPANLVRHLDTSMKTGLGLKEIHESFGIPFLNVLRETHRKQFEQKTREINKLLQSLDGHSHGRSRRPAQQKQDVAAQPTSHKETISSKRNLPLPASIQTTGPTIKPIPQSLSPTSPGRKTRNEYTNVDILSPTPVSAQTPAVLFDFSAGKLEEDFFQNVPLDSAPGAVGKGESMPATSVQEPASNSEANISGNPMVAGDEDIEDGSNDEEADASSHPSIAPIWTPGQAEKELLSRHMVKGSEERHLDEIQNDDDDDMEVFTGGDDGAELKSPESSEYSTQGNTSPLHHLVRQDSDIESQPDFPVASAMYYEHELSAFTQEEHQLGSAMNPVVLSHYEEIADGQGGNPWVSDGDQLNGAGTHSEDGYKPRHEEDKNEESREVAEALSTGMDNSMIKMKDKVVEINTEVSSLIEAGRTSTSGPSPVSTVSTDNNNGAGEAEEAEEEDGSPVTSNFQEKKKVKRSKKKKGKKGK
ncbi:hypothetical protein BGZ80_001162 [Entomortierella chlamydospora]|uniref:Uncharacterized protein n=1 Tax=Entomortierella chlamydospora TaxID=101097 RepID=A0A9P6N1T9_9FUNG|nr:hypothetical protein BGZ80_001162 [Entomortierella chlamydospora]